jgi:dTDP-glucose 4,6-dehydratase
MDALLITGTSGFIGSSLLERFCSDTTSLLSFDVVLALDKVPTPASFLPDEDAIPYVSVPIELGTSHTTEQLRDLFSKYRIGYVIHMAAKTHVDESYESCDAFYASNVVGTKQLLDVISEQPHDRRVKGIVVASTDEVYGPTPEDGSYVSEDHPFRPTNPYAMTKAFMETMIQDTYLPSLPIVVTRSNNVFGPEQVQLGQDKVIPQFFRTLTTATTHQDPHPLTIHSPGTQRRAFLYITDAINVIVSLLRIVSEDGSVRGAYNVAAPKENEVSVLELAALVTRVVLGPCNSNIELRPARRIKNDSVYRVCDSKLQRVLSSSPPLPPYCSLEKGLLFIANH